MTENAQTFKIVGFTGTRKGVTLHQNAKLFSILNELLKNGAEEFHHGDCVGADYQAAHLAHYMGYRIICYPPASIKNRAFFEYNDLEYPCKEPRKRNYDIVDVSDILVAAPATNYEILRSGTWATIRYAMKIGKTVIRVYP